MRLTKNDDMIQTGDLAQHSTVSQCQNAFLYRASVPGLP